MNAEGWDVHGYLPETHGEITYWGEDVVSYSRADRIVDVGWYPEEDPGGWFVCRLVYCNNWSEPDERLETRNLELVRMWVAEKLEEYRGS